MKRLCNCMIVTILFTFLPVGARAAQLLIPGGQVIGLQLHSDTVTVAAFDDTVGSCAKKAGFCIGDEILTINGHTVHSAGDIRAALEESGSSANITIRRDAKTRQLQITPLITAGGPRLGIYLKQGMTGIGTTREHVKKLLEALEEIASERKHEELAACVQIPGSRAHHL